MGRRRSRARAHTARPVGLVAGVALALVVIGACAGGSSSGAARAAVGKRAPTFVAPRIVGKGNVRLADYRGKPVLVNFFASWCEPCRDELPLLQRTADSGKAVVIPVLFNDSVSNARRFLQEVHVTLPAVEDDGGIARAYRVAFKPGLPLTWVVSTKGVAVARHIGQLRTEDIPSLLGAAN